MESPHGQMLDAYFGVASDWTLDVEPAEDDEVRLDPGAADT